MTAVALPVLGLSALLVLLLPGDALAASLRDGLQDGLAGIGAADGRWLALVAALLAASAASSALAWRAALRACGVRCGAVDAVARFSIGSLANALLPARVGGVIRIGLFSRLVHAEGAVWTTSGAAAVAGLARSLWLGVVIALASTTGLIPAWPAAVMLGLGCAGVGVGLLALRTRFRARAAHLLDAFAALRARPRGAVMVMLCVGGAIAGRVAAVSCLALAFGVERPLAAGVLAVAAIEVAAILPVNLGGAGMAGGALAFALTAHGVAGQVAVSAGITLAAAEAGTAVVVGALGTAVLTLPLLARWARPATVAVSLAEE